MGSLTPLSNSSECTATGPTSQLCQHPAVALLGGGTAVVISSAVAVDGTFQVSVCASSARCSVVDAIVRVRVVAAMPSPPLGAVMVATALEPVIIAASLTGSWGGGVACAPIVLTSGARAARISDATICAPGLTAVATVSWTPGEWSRGAARTRVAHLRASWSCLISHVRAMQVRVTSGSVSYAGKPCQTRCPCTVRSTHPWLRAPR